MLLVLLSRLKLDALGWPQAVSSVSPGMRKMVWLSSSKSTVQARIVDVAIDAEFQI